jgi:putative intracellular protease/amidase
MRIAIVVYDGVLASEYEAFSCVLGLIDGVDLITVGAHPGSYAGPGGRQSVDATFAEVDRVDVAVVPGGLGCERAADDPDLREFLVRMQRSARFIASSSTGSVVLASAGLLHGASAATHWLAGDLLRQYGSEADDQRLVSTGNIITCQGMLSAVDAAFSLVERLEGPNAIAPIRATLLERGAPYLRPDPWWHHLLDPVRDLLGARARGEAATTTGRRDEHSTTPLSVMVELVDNDDLARQMKRSARRRR